MIKACFTLIENKLTNSGDKNIYIKIIDENSVSKTPYIYSVIIINSDKIALSSHNFLIRITYTFKTKNLDLKTAIEKDFKLLNGISFKQSEKDELIVGLEKGNNCKNFSEDEVIGKLKHNWEVDIKNPKGI